MIEALFAVAFVVALFGPVIAAQGDHLGRAFVVAIAPTVGDVGYAVSGAGFSDADGSFNNLTLVVSIAFLFIVGCGGLAIAIRVRTSTDR